MEPVTPEQEQQLRVALDGISSPHGFACICGYAAGAPTQREMEAAILAHELDCEMGPDTFGIERVPPWGDFDPSKGFLPPDSPSNN